MDCEICGVEIRGKPQQVMVERSVLHVCAKCARLGTQVCEPVPPEPQTPHVAPMAYSQPKTASKPRTGTPRPASRRPTRSAEREVADDYSERLRLARQKAGLSQEELAKKVMEKVNIVKQLERGDLFPEDEVRRKLERALGISLLETELESEPTSREDARGDGGLTLGDLIQIRKK